jgi:uncharacterized phage-associated protein
MLFDYRKAVQAINYFIQLENSGEKLNKLKTVKLLWLADRYHLRRYSRPITNDSYVAMDNGPVGSASLDVINSNMITDDAKEIQEYADQYIKLDRHTNAVNSLNGIDLSVFSETEKEAIAKVYEYFGHYSPRELREISHQYPEWKKHEQALLSGSRSKWMSYMDFFEDNVDSELFNEAQEHLILSREIFTESYPSHFTH